LCVAVGAALAVAPVASGGTIGAIYPLGDSITYGETTPAGYRNKLYADLAGGGHTFSFVGTCTINPSPALTAAGQTRHEGHRGYRIDQLSNNLDGSDTTGDIYDDTNHGGFWLSNAAHTTSGQVPQTDVILVHAGTNDILQNGTAAAASARLDALLNGLVTLRPNANVIVASIIPITSRNSTVQAYNATIPGKVSALSASGRHVTFVDQYAGFVNPDGTIKTSLLNADGVHPNQAGYDVMADRWYAGIQSIPEPASLGLLGLAGLALLARTAGRTRHPRDRRPMPGVW
jgi:lysophospholipase L1-like esterase